MDQKPHYRSGESADMSGISPDTLRHYERMKLLAVPRRSADNYRLYPPEALARVRLIRHALAVGFSLPELAKILKVRGNARLFADSSRGLGGTAFENTGRSTCQITGSPVEGRIDAAVIETSSGCVVWQFKNEADIGRILRPGRLVGGE